jgi:dihydrodipicolinate synthase/N-acetylneuraminate lyase
LETLVVQPLDYLLTAKELLNHVSNILKFHLTLPCILYQKL